MQIDLDVRAEALWPQYPPERLWLRRNRRRNRRSPSTKPVTLAPSGISFSRRSSYLASEPLVQ